MIEVKVTGLALDSQKVPVVLLKEIGGERVLPIWIGPAEANAIALSLDGIKTERPLTHDLLKNLIDAFKTRVSKVIISELKHNTFFARIFLERDGTIISIDARPSDSIALAMRSQSPIFVSEEVMSTSSGLFQPNQEEKAKSLRNYLKRLNLEDFGKYDLNTDNA